MTKTTVENLSAEITLNDAAATMAHVTEQNIGESVQNFSVNALDLFMGADWVVQSVMISLLLASIWSWALIFAKTSQLRSLNKLATSFEDVFWSGKSLTDVSMIIKKEKNHPLKTLLTVGMGEWTRNPKALSSGQGPALQDRVARLMGMVMSREMDRLESYMIFLASVGSTAPFIGLFGTVWGIMNSFQGIALSGSTNLAVVAPGIAEALFATAIGLIAAIPAVLGYNKISSDINKYNSRLEAFCDEFSTILSRKASEREIA